MGIFYLDKNKASNFILCFSKNTIAIQLWQWGEIEHKDYESIREELESVILGVKNKNEPRSVSYIVKIKCSDGDIHERKGRYSYKELIELELSNKKYFCEEHKKNHSIEDIFQTWFKDYYEMSKDFVFWNNKLLFAAKVGNNNSIKLCLANGANANFEDPSGVTPLHWSAENAHTASVVLLIEYGSNINSKDITGQIPLHKAAVRGHTDTVAMLLRHGSSIDSKDGMGRTPYDLAGNKVIRKLLKAAQHNIIEDLLKELNELGLETVSEFKQMLQQGTYKSYWNRLYLVGPYGVGKTTLAKLLIEEEIPDTWNNTDGIFIYLGRVAMDTDSKKWVSLKKGKILNAAVMSLLKSKKKTVTQPLQEPSEAITRPVQKEQSMFGAVVGVDYTTGTSKESGKGGPSDDEIMALVLKECRQGDYKMIVVPIDIWDLGGQKIYYLTHQLFISSRGTFVVTFNGNKDITEDMPDMAFLPGFKGRTTTADFLLHWVNSILTFCEKTTTPSGKKYPQILFVATHKDKTTNVDQQRNSIKDSLKALFKKHVGKDHLLIDKLFFLNAKDKNDEDLAALRDALIDVAFEHPSWGEPMPTKFVPLELQLAKQASDGKKILSITEVKALNTKNEGMSLQPKELDTFLKVQHALGKLIYFDEDNLREYVVTDPAYLIDVLRSIVTEKLFWPKDKAIRETYEVLSRTGIIEKSAILQLWQQTDFNHIIPFREFMIDMIVRLDIMLEPKTKSDNCYFIVPSMITDRPFEDTFHKEKCIYLAYRFTEQIIPPALLYRFLGSFITLRNLNTDINKLRLFTDSAVVTIDREHQVQAYIVGNRIILALMHEQSKSDIKPSIASTVQECLTRSIVGTTDFYCAIANTTHKKSMTFPFVIEFSVPCTNDLCFVEHNKITREKGQRWTCRKHRIQHGVTHMSLWFSDKEPIQAKECAIGCTGLEKSWLDRYPEAKHLRRLGAILNHEETRNLLLALKLEKTKWDNLETQLGKRNLEDMHFKAFWYWRQEMRSSTFRLLSETLQKEGINACLLCRIVCDIELGDFPTDMMAWIPDDAALEDLCHHVGNATFQLGIELGLTVTELENIERNHNNLMEQTREVFKKWKESLNPEEHELPVIALAKSLKRIKKEGLVDNLKYHFENAK